MIPSTYIICATPRSGTTLLCDLLTSTGIAGKPASYYRKQSIARWSERLAVARSSDRVDPIFFERAYLAAILKEGTGRTDRFGLRLMWESLPELITRLNLIYPDAEGDLDRLERAFGQIIFIHLHRQDRLAQAISRLKAEQSGLWHVASDGSDRERTGPALAPDYDPDRLAALMEQTGLDDTQWNQWFARERIEPVRLTYEDLTTDPRQALAGLLKTLGLDEGAAAKAEIATRKMADRQSLEWAERFRTERGGLTVFSPASGYWQP